MIGRIAFEIADALFWAAPWPRGPVSIAIMRVMQWPAKQFFRTLSEPNQDAYNEPPEGCFWYTFEIDSEPVAVPIEHSASPGEWVLQQRLSKKISALITITEPDNG